MNLILVTAGTGHCKPFFLSLILSVFQRCICTLYIFCTYLFVYTVVFHPYYKFFAVFCLALGLKLCSICF